MDKITIPVSYAGDLGLVFDSFSTAGCRTEFFSGQDLVDLDDSHSELGFWLEARPGGSPLYLNPGTGPILKLYSHTYLPSEIGSAISLDGYNTTWQPYCHAEAGRYSPITVSAIVSPPPCCIGTTGNVDCSGDGKKNLADMTKLIDRVYISKVGLCCEGQGNTDGDSEGKINLSDITRLIDHVYISKAETALCE